MEETISMTYRELLDKLKSDIENITNETEYLTKELNLKNNDARKDFFGLFQTVIDEYYLGLNTFIFFKTNNPVNIYKIYVYENEIKLLDNHIRKLFAIKENEVLKKKYINNLEKNLILGCFAVFETCVNLIFNKIYEESKFHEFVIQEIKKDESKFLNQNDFNENQKGKIIEKLFDKLTLHKKFRYLSKDKYSKEIRTTDLEFIKFISDYRNCIIHSNGICNNDFKKTYFNSIFIFKKNHTVKIINKEDFSFTSWSICFEMKDIFIRLIKTINYDELIEYPEQ